MSHLCLIPKTLLFSHPFRSDSVARLRSVATRAMSTESTQRVFQLKHDPLTGNSEWIVIEENDEAIPETSTDGLLARTSYLDMLNDSRRNRAFRLAIEKTITKPCHVLDIGAGTGLLSMMAARAMMMSREECSDDMKGAVTACESYLPMVKLMRKVVHMNGLGKNINIINMRSDELKVGPDIASRAHVLVSEILDSELLGEGLIPTLQHAHDMLLVENPKTVPYRATTYCQLVESTFLWDMHDLYNNEAKKSDGIHLVPAGSRSLLGVKSQQYPMHVNAIEKEIKLLSEPVKIFEFDFWKRPESNRELDVHIEAIAEGRIHAIISWWVLQLDSEGTIFYSTAPKWIDSSNDTRTGVTTGNNVFGLLLGQTQSLTAEMARCESSAADLLLTLLPERIAVYGDNKYRFSMLEAVRKALQGKFQPLCVIVDDSLLLPLSILHISNTSHVIILSPGLQENGARYLDTVADTNGFSKDHFEYFRKGKVMLTDTHRGKVDLLIGEPYYYGLEGGLPWQSLRFWKDRTMLDSVLSKDVVIMPYKGVLRACAMHLPDLWKSRCCLSKVEGLDHAVVNTTLGASGNVPSGEKGPCLPFFIWQCGEAKRLSGDFTIMEFDFSKPISPCFGGVQIEFTTPGVCHGFALWIDWVMDAENSVVVSTGPDQRYWKQGVKLVAKPVTVESRGLQTAAAECCSAVVEASWDPSPGGELIIAHTFS